MEYRVGDKVKVVKKLSNVPKVTIGNVYEVVEVEASSDIRYPVGVFGDVEHQREALALEEIELVQPESEKKEETFVPHFKARLYTEDDEMVFYVPFATGYGTSGENTQMEKFLSSLMSMHVSYYTFNDIKGVKHCLPTNRYTRISVEKVSEK